LIFFFKIKNIKKKYFVEEITHNYTISGKIVS